VIVHGRNRDRDYERVDVLVNMDTHMVRNAGVTPRSTVEEGLEAVLNLVESPVVGTGGYYNGRRAARANAQTYDEEARAALRRLSEELVGS
jgi:hypothetical protein